MEAPGFLQRARSRRQQQEEQSQLPTCPLVYAVIVPTPSPAAGGAALPAADDSSIGGLGSKSSSPLRDGGGGDPGSGGRGGRNGVGAGFPPSGRGGSRRHSRAKSWDVTNLAQHMLLGGGGGVGANGFASVGQQARGPPALKKAVLASLSLAVECLMNTALVTVEGTWTIDTHGLASACEWMFVLPVNHKVSISSVEVVTGDARFFTTAIVTAEEAASVPGSQLPGGGLGIASFGSAGLGGRGGFLRAASGRFGSWGGGSMGGGSILRSRSRDNVAKGGDGGGSSPLGSGSRAAESGSPGASGSAGSGSVVGGFGGGKLPLLLAESEEFNPMFFRLRLPKIVDGSQVKVRVTYVESMTVKAGFYEVCVPLTIPADVLPPPEEVPLHSIVGISCVLNSGHPKPMKIGDFNHPMKVMFVELGRASFTGYPGGDSETEEDPWPNVDFVVSYQVVCDDASAAMLVQAPYEEDPDTRAIFCCSIAPPDPVQMPVYPRAIVFILDSHHAMRGKAMEEARKAILGALKRLSPHDSFAIIAFDYELLVFSEKMERATPETVKRAGKFVLQAYDSDQARNILSPLQLALKLLKGVRGVVPQIVLMADAAAEDERAICRYLQEALIEWGPNAPRIFTCGIGPSCSFHFLRWIAGISRGCTEVAFHADEVRRKVERLLVAVSRPLITNISVKDMPSGLQLFPFPIPDLYAGLPVTVSGKLDGDVPLHFELRGVRANGSPWKARVPLVDAANLPLSAVGVRDQVDLLTSDAWLQEDKDLEAQVARLSTNACIPSLYTRMMAFETTRELYDDLQQDRIQGAELKVTKYMAHPTVGPIIPVLGLVIGLHAKRSSHNTHQNGPSLEAVPSQRDQNFGAAADSAVAAVASAAEGRGTASSKNGAAAGIDGAGRGGAAATVAAAGASLAPRSTSASAATAASASVAAAHEQQRGIAPRAVTSTSQTKDEGDEPDMLTAPLKMRGRGFFSTVLSCYRPKFND